MDSPGNAKPDTRGPSNVASTCSDSPPVQESPYSVFLNNLSPLELKKAANGPQGFVGINSPPLVFTSPRITLPCDAHTFKRPQVLQLSTEESPQPDACAIPHQDDSKKPETVLVADNEDFVVRDFVEAQPSNSSSGIEGFLVDPVMVDCANSSFPTDRHWKEVGSTSLSDRTLLKITATDLEQSRDAAEPVGNKLEESGFQKSRIVWKKMEIREDRYDSEHCANDFSNALSDASLDDILEIRQSQNFTTQSAGGNADDKFENPTNSIPGSFSKAKAYQDCDVNAGAAVSYLPSRHHSEVMTKHRAVLRRCLFDEASPDNSSTRSSHSSASNMMSPGFSAATSELERLNITRARSASVSRKNEVQEMSKHIGSNVPPRTRANYPLIASRPLGIGLHLNSVVSGQTIGRITTTSSSQVTGYNLSTQEAKPTSFETWDASNNTTSCSSIEKVKSSAEESRHVIDTSDIRTTAMVESPHDIEAQTFSMPLECFAEGSPYDFDTSMSHASAKRSFTLDRAESPDEISQMSPKKKRVKKELSISAGDGCKRCNCRKSKCLKLYCDCFAAGLYCSEPCACQGCFNRPEYQDKVNDTRKQIESRNPSAFAPKIVESVNQLPEKNMERESMLPPSLARHKRGCNCKKSMCLKKYCECYQANVGCSDNCRCEGCRNVYGTKQDYGLSKQLRGYRAGDVSDGEENYKPLAANDGSLLIELHDPHSLTPLTPSLQFSDHGKGAPRPCPSLARFVPSPDSDVSALLSADTKPTEGAADSSVMRVSRSKGISESGMQDRSIEPSSEIVDGFSPRRDSLLNLSHLTPRMGRPVATRTSSSSSSKARDSIPARGSRIVLVSKSGEESSSSYSLQGRTTPITPITDLLLTGKSGKNLNSGSGITEVLEDDTPEILKEASTPTKPLNVSSPNKKRVSPPHSRVGSNTSVSLKSGRKFILKAVPSFPPLTPCIESRGSKILDTTSLQDDSTNK